MKIAVVGGIGSGKSEVMKIVAQMGVATLSADEINSRLLSTPDYISKVARRFPSAVQNGEIVRKTLADLIFKDENARRALNSLAHPLILDAIKSDERSPLVVEVPLLFESGAEKSFDKIVFVETPLESRIARLKSSRGMTEEEVLARIRAQVDEKRYFEIADFVIRNDSGLDDLKAKTTKCFEDLQK